MPKCLNCKTKFVPKTFLQKYCLETDECISAFRIYAQGKVKQQNEKKRRVEKSELREKLKTKSDHEKDLQKEVNTVVRILDFGGECISTLKPLNTKYDAGHLFSVGSNPTIRFNLFNIFAQSVHANQWKSGDQLNFIAGIKTVYGQDILDLSMGLKAKYPIIKLSIEELKEKTSIARGIIKWLRLQDKKFSIEERISLRCRTRNR